MTWPSPYHQPNPRQDCGYYALAYICRCLGHPDVTAQQVMDWRHTEGKHESHYPSEVLGLEMVSWWRDSRDEQARSRWWLGPTQRSFVEEHLDAGYIGLANIHRVPELHHCTALLEYSPGGVLLMDPVAGMVTEPWEWFLGPGAGNNCHRIEAWYRRRHSEETAPGLRGDTTMTTQQPTTRWFHSQDGLYFTRHEDGSVTITKTDGPPVESGGVPRCTRVVDAGTWASIVLSMTAFGERGGDWHVWMGHHQGERDLIAEAQAGAQNTQETRP